MGKWKAHNPIRTCISCGAKRPKKELIRMVVNPSDSLIRDDRAIKHGRGAYVCDSSKCLERLKQNKHLNRYFRTDRNISVDADSYGN